MEAIKLKGRPLTEEQLKAVKGGYEFISFKSEPEPNVCPVCEMPLSDSNKTDTAYDENGKVVGYVYRCNECGCMVEANGKA